MSDTWNAEPASTETTDAFNAADTAATENGDAQNTQSSVPAHDEEARQVAERGWTAKQPESDAELKANTVHAQGAVYEWDKDYGDVAPRIPELEDQLFKNSTRVTAAEDLSGFNVFDVLVEGPNKIDPVHEWADAGLHPVVLENIKHCNYSSPTAIQKFAVSAILKDGDVLATAQTGSGKTAAFLVPVLSKLMGKAQRICGPKPKCKPGEFEKRQHGVRAEPVVVIVVPTRELALQIWDESRRLSYRSYLRPSVSYGGLPVKNNVEDLSKSCDILIATPGRLVHLLSMGDVLSFERVKYFIIDEADEMVDPSWEEQMRKIMSYLPENSDLKYLFFSATFPDAALDLAGDYLAQDHVRIVLGRAGSCLKATHMEQEIRFVDGRDKNDTLWDILMTIEPARVLIFANSKMAAEKLDDFLFNRGFPCTALHSSMAQSERERNLALFRQGHRPVMITTGVFARGLDVQDIKLIINFDIPRTIDEYVHRIGRTARIGHKGKAISFFNDRDEEIAPALVGLLLESGCEVPDFLEQFKDTGEGGQEGEEITEGMEALTTDDADGGGSDGAAAAWGTNGDSSEQETPATTLNW